MVTKRLSLIIAAVSILIFIISVSMLWPHPRKLFTHHIGGQENNLRVAAAFAILFVLYFNAFYFFLRKEIGRWESDNSCGKLPKYTIALSVLVVFVCFFSFFCAYPLIPWNGDDWSITAIFVSPFPNPLEWNPARLLCGIVSSVTGDIAAYMVYPILGDYLDALILVNNATAALSCTLLFYCLFRFFFSLSRDSIAAILSAALFILMSFCLFKSQVKSAYLLYIGSTSMLSYYMVPLILNSCLVLYLIAKANRGTTLSFETLGKYRYAAIIITIYFAMFSILYAGIIAASYSVSHLLYVLYQERKRGNFAIVLKDNAIHLLILILFALYMIFESSGSRALYHNNPVSLFSKEYLSRFLSYTKALITLAKELNHTFAVVALFFAINFFAILKVKRRYNSYLVVSLCLSPIFCVLATTVVRSLNTPSVVMTLYYFGFLFYLLIIISLMMLYVVKHIPRLFFTIPLAIIILLIESTVSNQYSLTTTYEDFSTKERKCIINNWLDAIKSADVRNEASVSITIPDYDGNWPVPDWIGTRLTETLYDHKIIKNKFTIHTEKVDNETLKALCNPPAK